MRSCHFHEWRSSSPALDLRYDNTMETRCSERGLYTLADKLKRFGYLQATNTEYCILQKQLNGTVRNRQLLVLYTTYCQSCDGAGEGPGGSEGGNSGRRTAGKTSQQLRYGDIPV